jgi:hypothetical protein
MMVRVGWITVPAAERYATDCFFLVAASTDPARAGIAAAVTKNAMTRMSGTAYCSFGGAGGLVAGAGVVFFFVVFFFSPVFGAVGWAAGA